MKLQTKVIGGFCAASAFTLVVSLIGYWQARNLASALYEVGTVRLPSIQGLDAIAAGMQSMQSTERALLLPQIDDATFAVQVRLEREARAKAEAGWAKYEPLPQTPDETVAWNAFRPAFREWAGSHDALVAEIVASRAAHDDAMLAAGQRRSLSEAAVLFDRAAARLAAISRINDGIVEAAKRGSVASQTDLVRTERLMLLTAAAGVSGAVALGVFMGRRLTRPIVQVADSLSRIADGDRTATLQSTSGDEIGQMVTAMNSMVTALRTSEGERALAEEELRQLQKMEAIGQLAGGIAHDFNNILTVILGKAAVLVFDARMPTALRAAASDIYRSGERAANLTRQLLAFSRRQAFQKRAVDLNVVVADIARMLRTMLGEAVTVEYVYGLNPSCVNADPGMLDQVLLNLAVNARDAMPEGGRLRIETALVTVDAEHVAHNRRARPGLFACLIVRDSGTGIAPENLARIFEPFFTTKDIGKGTGLGLATSHGIVLQHDGWIEVESEVGAGTTFRVFLPSVATAPEPLVSPVAQPAETSGSETILVVEDEDEVREFMVEVLLGLGYRVLEAANGSRALDVWSTHSAGIDLLLTDMVMPEGITGIELARTLRLGRPELPVICTSGYLADAANLSVLVEESTSYLAKPFSVADLASTVRRTLDAAADPAAI